MSLLNLIDAGYSYPGTEKWIFRHFDLSIKSGEAIRIIGPNGSGKTTLLRVLSGLLELREGNFLNEEGVNVTYMDQFSGEMLARDLTIAEQLKVASYSESSRSASMKMLGEFGLGLDRRVKEFVGHLSGGQRQIVALLCTLAAGARVLCLDEFISSMDDQSSQVANRLLREYKSKSGITLVLVSHSGIQLAIDRELNLDPSE